MIWKMLLLFGCVLSTAQAYVLYLLFRYVELDGHGRIFILLIMGCAVGLEWLLALDMLRRKEK